MGSRSTIVAATRLPVRLRPEGDDLVIEPSPGGLATALRGISSDDEFIWVGWPGTYVPPEKQRQVEQELRTKYNCVPVFLTQEETEGFYGDFSNRRLWPLFHNLPSYLENDRDAWTHYQRVNQRFAEAISWQARSGDLIWVHDYQLTLVPELVRRRTQGCPIGYFLHIPFPSSETYRTLPHRETILRGMLGANLIGFHSYEYVSHFRNSCLRLLGVESNPDTLWAGTHEARLEVLPVGIDTNGLRAASAEPDVVEYLSELREQFAGHKVVIGVDRLDYTKGLPEKLLAFRQVLSRRPELRGKVVLVQIAAPSRTDVPEYQELKRRVDGLVGDINGRFGTVGAPGPVVYINQNIPQRRLTALYQLADIALVTPMRDGMNLVSLEYIASRIDDPGTLIISEFAGAAGCLPGARIVNPHDVDKMADLLEACLLEEEANAEAFGQMRAFVEKNTAQAWAGKFLGQLEAAWDKIPSEGSPLTLKDSKVLKMVSGAHRPLVLLDYDGTLRSHVPLPKDAVPPPELLRILAKLQQRATVYVVSGRPAEVLDDWLGELGLGMVCEHGLAVKHPGGKWTPRADHDARLLQELVMPILQNFVDRTPGSMIEQKQASVAWHYRACDFKLGSWRAKELLLLLSRSLQSQPFVVLRGSRVVEVRPVGVTKGHAVQDLLTRYADADLVLCAGDDRTDEDMFEVLEKSNATTITCRIGNEQSAARYCLETPDEFRAFLEAMSDALPPD